MASVRDILQRFRPAGAPGAAGLAGVPADRIAELSAELAPVFDLMADVELEAAGIRAAAADQARACRAEAAQAAAAIRADAGLQADSARTEAFAGAHNDAELARSAALVAAHDEDERLRRWAADRLPRMASRAADLILRDLVRADAVPADAVPADAVPAAGPADAVSLPLGEGTVNVGAEVSR